MLVPPLLALVLAMTTQIQPQDAPPSGDIPAEGAPAGAAPVGPINPDALLAPPSVTDAPPTHAMAAVLEVECSLSQGRVLLTGGHVLLECPGFQRVELPVAGRVDLLLYVGKLPGRMHSVDAAAATITRLNISNDNGTAVFTTSTRPPDGAAAAPLSTFTVDPQPGPVEDPKVQQAAKAQGDDWKKTSAGLLTVAGAVLVVVGLTVAATAGTRLLAGNTSATPYPLPASANTAGWQLFNSSTFYAAPVLIVVAVLAMMAGAVMTLAGFVWMKAS